MNKLVIQAVIVEFGAYFLTSFLSLVLFLTVGGWFPAGIIFAALNLSLLPFLTLSVLQWLDQCVMDGKESLWH